MTEDVFVLDCHSDIFVWVGQEVDAKVKSQAMDIGEVKRKFIIHRSIRNRVFFEKKMGFLLPHCNCQKFLALDYLMEKLSRETTIFTVSEGSEPQFFTRFFNWDSAKSLVSSLCVLHLLIVNYRHIYSMILTPNYT